MSYRRLCQAILVCVLWSPSLSSAQASSRTVAAVAGVALSALGTSHPEGGTGSTGIVLGLDKRFGTAVGTRAVVGAQRAFFTKDDIALCHRVNGGCLADAVFPTWFYTFGMDAYAAPSPRVPLKLLAGIGGVFARSPRLNQRTVQPVDEASVVRPLWRTGLEVPLGRSTRAPALQVSHGGLGRAAYSMSSLTGATLLFRF